MQAAQPHPDAGQKGWRYVFDAAIQSAARHTATAAGFAQHVGLHTLRHGLATRLLQGGGEV